MCYTLTAGQERDILEVAYAVNNNYQEEGIYYRYDGSLAPERQFCRELMRINKLYRKDDINQMSFRGENSKFARRGTNKYSIFKYRGGANCKHYWRKIEVRLDEDGLPREIDLGIVDDSPVERLNFSKDMDVYEYVFEEDIDSEGVYGASLVLSPAIEVEGVFFSEKDIDFKEALVEWKLASEDKQIITAPVLIPNKKIYRNKVGKEGTEGLTFVSAPTIEKLQQNFFKNKNNHNSTIEHNTAIDNVYFFESWIVEDPQNDKSNSLGFKDLPKGTWMMSMKVDNKDVWDNYVKTNKVKGFSIDALLLAKKVDNEELNNNDKTEVKLSKMDKKTIDSIVAKAFETVRLASDLKQFDIEGESPLFATSLELDMIVTDEAGVPVADKTFKIEGKEYSTDKDGVIVDIKDKVEETLEVDPKIAELEAMLAEKEALILELEDKVAMLEEENNKLKGDLVTKENDIVAMSKQKPASKGVSVNKNVTLNRQETELEFYERIRKNKQ